MNTEALRRFCTPTFLALLLPVAARGQSADSSHKFQIHWNEYNLGFTTIVVGASLLTDYATYNQDSVSRDQFHVVRQGKIRDSRFLVSGVFNTKRAATWQTGIMYDWPTSKWLIRQTTITVAVPELWGWIHVGRTKEGLSLNRVMVGYD